MEGLVQIIIMICLIVVIMLLLVDKVKFIKPQHKLYGKVEQKAELDVIGKVLVPEKQKAPAWLANRKKLMEQIAANKSEQRNNDSIKNNVQKEIVSNNKEETDDWDNIPPDDERFGQGVSLPELMKVGNLLQQENIDEIQEKKAVEIMQKIQGTELYGLLENSIGEASQRIAKLLDRNLKSNESVDSDNQNGFDKFDIENFI